MTSIKNLLNRTYSELALLSILFLFFLQLVSDLVESIYMLDLLKTSLDEKVLGVLFLITPIILIFFRKGIPNKFLEIIAEFVVIFRVINPFMDTAGKIITAGIGAGCFMIFLPSYMLQDHSNSEEKTSLTLGVALAFAVVLSITFRALHSTIDISVYQGFQAIGWILAIIATLMIAGRFTSIINKSNRDSQSTATKAKTKKGGTKGILLIVLGAIGVITINYFSFISPTVIARWTEGDYISITMLTAIMIALFAILVMIKPDLIEKLKPWMIWLWNGLFILSILLTIIVNVVPFPPSPDSPPVVISSPTIFHYIPLIMMLVLVPIIFLDFVLFSREIIKRKPSVLQLAGSFTLGGAFFIFMVLMFIFTNVWGYIDFVSLVLRNLFWLPFLIIGLIIIGSVFIVRKKSLQFSKSLVAKKGKILISLFMIILIFFTGIGVFVNSANPTPPSGTNITSLRVFTYNIQQGVNITGDKNYDNQIALIKQVNPDIIGLQECDSARISLGNSDVVRYFADRLSGFNYYSYFGPKTVTGTFGTALLSKYPIISSLVFFTYSDVDEIGTTEVQIQVGSQILNVFVNHPDGGHEAKLAHQEALMDRISGKEYVISLGDFNYRENSLYYNLSVAVLQDAWLTRWPTGVDNLSLNMSSRIDHIFLSHEFNVIDTRYITDPQSDHPALWTEIEW